MPWQHCGRTLSDDVRTCPACKAGKASHTVRLGRTRVFALGTARFDGDPGAQAESLIAAHAAGAPFCETCERGEDEASFGPADPGPAEGDAP